MRELARPLGETVGLYAATLLPIAAGYVIAHYLTLVVAGVLWLPELVIHPVTSVQPNLRMAAGQCGLVPERRLDRGRPHGGDCPRAPDRLARRPRTPRSGRACHSSR